MSEPFKGYVTDVTQACRDNPALGLFMACYLLDMVARYAAGETTRDAALRIGAWDYSLQEAR